MLVKKLEFRWKRGFNAAYATIPGVASFSPADSRA
jgi:hypothetical protein